MNKKSLLYLLQVIGILGLTTGCYTNSSSPGDQPESLLSEVQAKCVTAEDADRMADQVLQLVNLERAAAGLTPVVVNSRLEQVASDYACLMIDEGFFGHLDPLTGRGPGERVMAGKYSFYVVGENLAAGQESAAEVMHVWMESPSHKAIILDQRWQHIGISVRLGGEHGIYWVQEFGDPADFLSRK